VLADALVGGPHRRPEPDVRRSARLLRAGWYRVDPRGDRHGHVFLGRLAVPLRWGERAALPHAGDDAADRCRDHRGLSVLTGRDGRDTGARPGVLVGAGAADRDHAARSLDRDALPVPDLLRAGLAGGTVAG